MPTAICPRSLPVPPASQLAKIRRLEVAQLESEGHSVGIRVCAARIQGMYTAPAIDRPSEMPPVEALLDKRLLVQLSQAQVGRDWILLPTSLSVSVARVVLLVLLRANRLSIAAHLVD